MFRSSCLNGRVLDFVLVALPLALVDRDLAAFDFHYVCAVIRADKNCVNLAVETLVGDVDGWNHYPGFVKVLEKALDDDRLRMFEDRNIEVRREELRHGIIVLPFYLVARGNPGAILAVHLLYTVM